MSTAENPSLFARVKSSRSAWFLAYLTTTILGGSAAFIASDAIWVGPQGPGGAYFAEQLLYESDNAGAAVRAVFAVTGLTLLVSPWLHLTWLAAMKRPQALADALRDAARQYLKSWGVTFGIALVSGITAVFVAIPTLAATLVTSTAAEEDIVILSTIIPLGALCAIAFLWNDLARAALIHSKTSIRGAMGTGLRAMRFRPIGVWLTTVVLGRGLVAGGATLAVTVGFDSFLIGIAVVALLQVLAFTRLGIRGLWLARSLDAVAATHPPT